MQYFEKLINIFHKDYSKKLTVNLFSIDMTLLIVKLTVKRGSTYNKQTTLVSWNAQYN